MSNVADARPNLTEYIMQSWMDSPGLGLDRDVVDAAIASYRRDTERWEQKNYGPEYQSFYALWLEDQGADLMDAIARRDQPTTDRMIADFRKKLRAREDCYDPHLTSCLPVEEVQVIAAAFGDDEEPERWDGQS